MALNYKINPSFLIENIDTDFFCTIPNILTYINKISSVIETLENHIITSEKSEVQRIYIMWNMIQLKKKIELETSSIQNPMNENLSKKQILKKNRAEWDSRIASIISFWTNLFNDDIKNINIINFILHTSTKNTKQWWCAGYCSVCMKSYSIINYYYSDVKKKYFNFVYSCNLGSVYCMKCIDKYNLLNKHSNRAHIFKIYNFDDFDQEYCHLKNLKSILTKECDTDCTSIYEKYNSHSNSELQQFVNTITRRIKNVSLEITYLKNILLVLRNNIDNNEDLESECNDKIQKVLNNMFVNYELFIPSSVTVLTNDNFGMSLFIKIISKYVHQYKYEVEKCKYKLYLYDKLVQDVTSYHDDHIFSDTCVVCLEKYNFPFVTLTICQHRLCKFCFDRLPMPLTCPVCRRSIVSIVYYTMDKINHLKKHLVHYV